MANSNHRLISGSVVLVGLLCAMSNVMVSGASVLAEQGPDVYVLTDASYKKHVSMVNRSNFGNKPLTLCIVLQCHNDTATPPEPHCLWMILFHKVRAITQVLGHFSFCPSDARVIKHARVGNLHCQPSKKLRYRHLTPYIL